MSGKPCQPGCTCLKHHKWTAEHRANMSASVSAEMRKHWRQRSPRGRQVEYCRQCGAWFDVGSTHEHKEASPDFPGQI